MDISKRNAAHVAARNLRTAALYSFVTGAGTAAGTATVAWIVWWLQGR
ncbi:hypothetical protein ACWEQP_01910 [Streptomyces sp. NPDC004044]